MVAATPAPRSLPSLPPRHLSVAVSLAAALAANENQTYTLDRPSEVVWWSSPPDVFGDVPPVPDYRFAAAATSGAGFVKCLLQEAYNSVLNRSSYSRWQPDPQLSVSYVDAVLDGDGFVPVSRMTELRPGDFIFGSVGEASFLLAALPTRVPASSLPLFVPGTVNMSEGLGSSSHELNSTTYEVYALRIIDSSPRWHGADDTRFGRLGVGIGTGTVHVATQTGGSLLWHAVLLDSSSPVVSSFDWIEPSEATFVGGRLDLSRVQWRFPAGTTRAPGAVATLRPRTPTPPTPYPPTPTPTEVPTPPPTPAPPTPAPPDTPVPTVTPVPTTAAPTLAPNTTAPNTTAPTEPPPPTPTPTTARPETFAPPTPQPTSVAPPTPAPTNATPAPVNVSTATTTAPPNQTVTPSSPEPTPQPTTTRPPPPTPVPTEPWIPCPRLVLDETDPKDLAVNGTTDDAMRSPEGIAFRLVVETPPAARAALGAPYVWRSQLTAAATTADRVDGRSAALLFLGDTLEGEGYAFRSGRIDVNQSNATTTPTKLSVRLRGHPQYRTLFTDTITVVVRRDAFEPGRCERSSAGDLTLRISVKPNPASNALLVKSVQGAASASGAITGVASVAGIVGSAALLDTQVLFMMSQMQGCERAAQTLIAKPMAVLLSPFESYSFESQVGGNALIIVVCVAIHVAVMLFVAWRRRISNRIAAAAFVGFPSTSVSIAFVFHAQIVFASIAVSTAEEPQNRSVGVLGIGYMLGSLVAAWRLVRFVEAQHPVLELYPSPEVFPPKTALFPSAVPQHRWTPTQLRRLHGWLFSNVNAASLRFGGFMQLLLLSVVALISAPRPAGLLAERNKSGCVARFTLVALLFLFHAVVHVVRPLCRMRVADFMTAGSSAALMVVALGNAADVHWPASQGLLAVVLGTVVNGGFVIARTAHELYGWKWERNMRRELAVAGRRRLLLAPTPSVDSNEQPPVLGTASQRAMPATIAAALVRRFRSGEATSVDEGEKPAVGPASLVVPEVSGGELIHEQEPGSDTDAEENLGDRRRGGFLSHWRAAGSTRGGRDRRQGNEAVATPLSCFGPPARRTSRSEAVFL